MLDPRPIYCFHHPDRETGRSCTRCGRPACPDCLHAAPVGSHCFECIKAARPPAKERLRRWNATAGPLLTKILIGINAAVFLVTNVGLPGWSPQRAEFDLSLFGPAVADGQLYRLVTTGFLHFGILHIGFNMLMLYRFGENLEAAFGRVRFVLLYFAALLAGSFGALILTPDSLTGGASGAVFGLMGATAVALRQRGLSLTEGGLGGLIVFNVILSFAVPGISIGGHLGGLAGGALAAFLLARDRDEQPAVGIAATVAVCFAAVVGSMLVVG